MHIECDLAEDILDGAEAIAQFLGCKPRRVFYLHETGKLPTFKLGNRICGRKSTFRAHIERLERGEAA